MKIEQFYDKGLAHASYAVLNNKEIILVDPARNPQPYYEYAKNNQAKIVGVIETHPHADFTSSHLEIHHTTGATIYTSRLVGADYPHQAFDEGDHIELGDISLEAINTPGHSPDSISVLVINKDGIEHALFTGDTLFVGDVGRPDLRENVGNIKARAEELARSLYHSTRDKIMTLPENVIIYPAHGPGSLCGKNISPELQSTIGKELKENPTLQDMSENDFVNLITEDQPWVPKYFQYNVALNKAGLESFEQSIRAATNMLHKENLTENVLIVDTRQAADFQNGHHKNAINIPDSLKFETWLGSIVNPSESFYLVGYDEASLHQIMEKVAKIGYEKFVDGLLWNDFGSIKENNFNQEAFDNNRDQFTVVDIRNDNEVKKDSIFKNAIHIPLPRLRESTEHIPTDKLIAVHCAGGLRSAIGSSILSLKLNGATVLDMGTRIKQYKS
ncbi:MBL fold metallo-hydrolase [Albibacterium bauzanense]|uniref:Glyoxylase-like metal-dependent hydrolase (Beta-lactamase superfamily II) n=1 Tax=Albibacterium bauzanense TaxID=653929 RepID=A0A4R1M0Q5_9SPHI|nr:rhodanese-like domain-containing protein [Albibacterium bauzanense]TCK84792.1 glyoxylase-like metal-dependent hydrolase (beta-lactamase superfamily II) [Albibacterium bauzanense]